MESVTDTTLGYNHASCAVYIVIFESSQPQCLLHVHVHYIADAGIEFHLCWSAVTVPGQHLLHCVPSDMWYLASQYNPELFYVKLCIFDFDLYMYFALESHFHYAGIKEENVQ
jgi:hypothetical protein